MRVLIHGELTDDGASWWAESPDHPEYTAAAATMAELKQLVRESADIESWTDPVFELAQPEE